MQKYYTRFIPDFIERDRIREYIRPADMNGLFALDLGGKTMRPSSFIAKADRELWNLKYALIPARCGIAKYDKVKGYRMLDVLHLAFIKGYTAVETQENQEYTCSYNLSLVREELAYLKGQVRECEQQARMVTGDFSDYGIVTKQPKFALLSKETLIQQAISNLAVCGVYFLIKGDEIVYIGQSVNIFARMSGHGNKDYDGITFVPCDKSELDILESLYILAYQPKLNGRTGNKNQGRISAPFGLQDIIKYFENER